MITSNMDNWDDLNHLDTELSSFSYLNNWDDHVKFEVIIQKRSQTTEIIGMIKAIPEIITFITVSGEKFSLDISEV